MNIKCDKNVSKSLVSEFEQYADQLNLIVKQISDITTAKNNWDDEKRKLFNMHMQSIASNVSALSKAHLAFAELYKQRIKELQ